MDLNSEKCVPCQVGAPILKGDDLQRFMNQVDGWELYDGETKIRKDFELDNFDKAVNFINEIAKIAQEEGHHPNLYLHDFKNVTVECWTHKIGGLHKNDFILASKIDKLSS